MPKKGAINTSIRDENGNLIPWKKRNRKLANDGARKRRAERKLQNPDFEIQQRRKWFLKYKFGITPELREALIKAQDNKCAICKKYYPIDSSNWATDHEHNENYLRGMLCKSCNLALGLFQDSIENLQNALNYLIYTKSILDEPSSEDFIEAIKLLETIKK